MNPAPNPSEQPTADVTSWFSMSLEDERERALLEDDTVSLDFSLGDAGPKLEKLVADRATASDEKKKSAEGGTRTLSYGQLQGTARGRGGERGITRGKPASDHGGDVVGGEASISSTVLNDALSALRGEVAALTITLKAISTRSQDIAKAVAALEKAMTLNFNSLGTEVTRIEVAVRACEKRIKSLGQVPTQEDRLRDLEYASRDEVIFESPEDADDMYVGDEVSVPTPSTPSVLTPTPEVQRFQHNFMTLSF